MIIMKTNGELMKNTRISYSIMVNGAANNGSKRHYSLSTNDPSGTVTQAINDKSGVSFICDFTCTTIVPSGYPTSSGEVKEHCMRADLPQGMEIKDFIAKMALIIDNFSLATYHDAADISNWKKNLLALKK